ncbi:MAG: TetR/AcrR family transcriptional regulator [Candidatus Izemoplasmatales bacterium]|jgi:AcrR family transcriptional regulator|nr:TetR/AcrR family transcriptional regulator [Candidatus Izemoplasmatales bacterium]
MKNKDKTQLLLDNKELFNATIDEFSKKSYDLASINEIIKASNINKGSFYYRFANKEELFVAMMDYVIVKQIDLFNERKIHIYEIIDLKDALFEMFYNLYLLYNESKAYFSIISNHLKDFKSLELINEYCVEPLKARFFKKIHSFSRTNKNFENILMVIDSLYYEFPERLLLSKNPREDILNFVNFILTGHNKNITSIDNSVSLIEYCPERNMTFLLVKDFNLNINENYILADDIFLNIHEKTNELKKMTKILFLNHKKLIKNLIKYSFKDISYLKGYLNKKIIDAMNDNQEFKLLVLTCVYLSIKEERYLSFGEFINIFSQKEIELFYLELLPILKKTSKILMINNNFNLNLIENNLFYLNSVNQVLEIDRSNVLNNYINHYLISYLNNGIEVLENLDNDKFSSFISKIDSSSIIDIKVIRNLNYDLIKRIEAIK